MRRLFLIVTAWTLVVAKPELYKEKEDFQYSRSSSDDGSKSGFYGAQRGNMGGNYEKAHNMDMLAQHQMSGLVRQVHGELGDASKTRTGSVFTAANSRGIYGSGNYDLSNLEGRNFQEGTAHDGSNSHSSLSSYGSGYDGHTSSLQHNAGYSSSQLQNSGYSSGHHASGHSGQNLHSSQLQSSDMVGGRSYEHGSQASSGYHSQSGYHDQSAYDYSNIEQQNANSNSAIAHSRLVSAVPVRVIIRPGTRVAVPVAAQTYDAAHSASSYDQNAINSDTEVLNNAGYDSNPSTNNKRYESSYSYRKEWEKHDTKPVVVPLAVPTMNPFPKNSQLYDDTQVVHSSDQLQASQVNSQSAHLSNANRYNANLKTSLDSQSQYQTGYNAQHRTSSTGSNTNAYTHGAYNTGTAHSTNGINDVDSSPKSYQSAFSYHKSWERQGDPYIIKPSTNGLHDVQSSQRLTAGSANQGAYSSQQYGSNYKQLHQSYSSHAGAVDCDCDENGHIRVARSYNTDQLDQEQQQSQGIYDGLEQIGQQTQTGWENLEDLGQQTQSKWDNLENLGQQTQGKWQLEDLGQQTQNKWDKLEDLGQQTQKQWNNFNIENTEQKSENKMNKETEQITNNKWHNYDILGLQTQNTMSSSQKDEKNKDSEKTENFNQETPRTLNKPKEVSHDKAVNYNNQQNNYDHGPRNIQSTWDKLDNIETYKNDNQERYNVQSTEVQNQFVSNFEQNKRHQISQNHNLSQEHNKANDLGALKQNGYATTNDQVNHTQEQPKESSLFKNTDNIDQPLTPYNTYDSNVWDYSGYSSGSPHPSNWKHSYTHTERNLNVFQTSYNSPINTHDMSVMQNTWDKEHNMNKEISNNKEESNGDNTYLYGQTSSQHFSQNWRQIYSANNSESTHNVNQQQNSHYAGFMPSQWTTFNEDINKTIISKDEQRSQANDSRARDVGRGDIDDTETSQISDEKKHPQIVSDSRNKKYKTPEEIESLSLTKEVSTTVKPTNQLFNYINVYQTSDVQTDSEKQHPEIVASDSNNGHKTFDEIESTILKKEIYTTIKPINNINLYPTTNQQRESALGVLSLNEQKKFADHEQNGNVPIITTTNPKTESYYNNANFQIVNEEQFQQNSNQKQEFVDHSLSKSKNDAIDSTKPVYNLPNYETNNKDVQLPEEFEQQNVKQLEDFGQQSQNFNQHAWGQNMEDFGQQSVWGQNLEDFGQQSQSTWEQNLDDLGQKSHEQGNSGKQFSHDNLQQSIQRDFTPTIERNEHKQGFYKENYQLNKYDNQEHKSVNTESLNIPEIVEKKNNNSELVMPQELTTEKTGFWKSVGSKFTSAKDTVAGWFQRS